MHVCGSTLALYEDVIKLYKEHISLQEQFTPESLQDELANVSGSPEQPKKKDPGDTVNEVGAESPPKKLTFIEKLMMGEIDFDKESDLVR